MAVQERIQPVLRLERKPKVPKWIPLSVALTITAAAVLGSLIWWMASPWFLSSSSLDISMPTVESTAELEAGSPGEWRYFGIDIVNTTDKPLTVGEAKMSNTSQARYSLDIISLDGPQGSPDGSGVGAVALEDLHNDFAVAWANRQNPRGFVLEPGQRYQLILGLGVTQQESTNAAFGVDVTFTDGTFRGTASGTGTVQVRLGQ
ncbi:hypothetical protein [Timonella senegalensis]|uniref:hypothetical protein n=1 Tax=Timonella senegalensis TaxID=1465825 RepID=UPI002FDEA470